MKLSQDVVSFLENIWDGKNTERSTFEAILGWEIDDVTFENIVTQVRSLKALDREHALNLVESFLNSVRPDDNLSDRLGMEFDVLFEPASIGRELPKGLRVGLGIISPYHQKALEAGIQNGLITRENIRKFWQDGSALTKALARTIHECRH
jgi:hypothetical protein